MSHQKSLQQAIGAVLAMLFVVGCGATTATQMSEAPIATATPEVPVVVSTPKPLISTATSVPPAATPVPSPTETRQVVEPDIWNIEVVSLKRAEKIKTTFGSFEARKGVYTLYLVELELENTADAASKLEVDPQQIVVLDSNGETHMARGGASLGSPFAIDGTSASFAIEPTRGGPSGTFTADWLGEHTNEWTIELTGKGPTRFTIAFPVPSNAQIKELRWPELPVFNLQQ